MVFTRPIQWYHSHADPIWLDGTFKVHKCKIFRLMIFTLIYAIWVGDLEDGLKIYSYSYLGLIGAIFFIIVCSACA
jgi:hypothetical protein